MAGAESELLKAETSVAVAKAKITKAREEEATQADVSSKQEEHAEKSRRRKSLVTLMNLGKS